MIFVEKGEPQDQSWRDLRDRGRTAAQAIVAAFDPNASVEFRDALYQGHMHYLKSIFRSKCAYCEEKLSGQPGDVEHFRPKGRVCDAGFKRVKVQDQAWGEIFHPGDYWLAYEWDNLLPSCADCNRFRWHEQDVGAGKADRFPVVGPYAVRPEDLARERALLIDPTKTDPLDHLKLEYDAITNNMLFRALTPEGETTIDMFGLNKRETLVAQRTLAYATAQDAFEGYVAVSGKEGNDPEVALKRKRVNDMWEGIQEYTAVQRFALLVIQRRTARRGVRVDLPIPEPEQP